MLSLDHLHYVYQKVDLPTLIDSVRKKVTGISKLASGLHVYVVVMLNFLAMYLVVLVGC